MNRVFEPFFQRDLSPIKFGSQLIFLGFHIYLENSVMAAILDLQLLEVGGEEGGEGQVSTLTSAVLGDG